MRFFNPQADKKDMAMKRWTTAITAIVKHAGNQIGSLEGMPEESRSTLQELRTRILRQDTPEPTDLLPPEGQEAGIMDSAQRKEQEKDTRARPRPGISARSISKIWEEEEIRSSSRSSSEASGARSPVLTSILKGGKNREPVRQAMLGAARARVQEDEKQRQRMSPESIGDPIPTIAASVPQILPPVTAITGPDEESLQLVVHPSSHPDGN